VKGKRMTTRWKVLAGRVCRVTAVVVTVAFVAIAAGCGSDGGPKITAAGLTADGWKLFESGEVSEALATFEDALAITSTYGEAYNGIGWCCIRLDSLERGAQSFGAAMANGVTSADPPAGMAIIYRDFEPVDFELAVHFADSALSLDPNYSFDHDPRLDWRDLRLILAQCLLGLKRYQEAKDQVDILNPANTLDPAADTFVEDLIFEVQRLEESGYRVSILDATR
jgi:tetratricopeptide (TPR) repeat protein